MAVQVHRTVELVGKMDVLAVKFVAADDDVQLKSREEEEKLSDNKVGGDFR